MSGNYLLDTNAFINAIRYRVKIPSAYYAYSVITELELLSFPELSLEEEQAIYSVLRCMNRVELVENIRRETIRIRRNKRMKLPDSIISASAICLAATLVTDDTKMAEQHTGDVISLRALVNLKEK